MSKINKLIDKLATIPTDFKETELDKVMAYFRYTKLFTSGSGVKYVSKNDRSTINFHHPHGKVSAIKPCTIRDILCELRKEGKLANS